MEEGAKENTRELHPFTVWSFLADTGPSLVLQLCRSVKAIESSIHPFSRENRALTLFPAALAHRAGCVWILCLCISLGRLHQGYTGPFRRAVGCCLIPSAPCRWGSKHRQSQESLNTFLSLLLCSPHSVSSQPRHRVK